jgi:hypothetical protein
MVASRADLSSAFNGLVGVMGFALFLQYLCKCG